MIFTSSKFIGVAAAALLALSGAQASVFDKPGVATYWGQNSKGGYDTQKPIDFYCDDASDIIVMSFVLNFKDGGLPTLNLANGCNGPNFPGTGLLQCSQVGQDIKACQKKGKTVLMSLGGAAGVYGFANNKDAEAFADTLWNLFGNGSSSTRPFGDAVLDGFDLDIEGGGPTGYAALVKRLRSHYATDKSKQYYITGAPQCPFPDAMMGPALDEADFDAVFVQFYNNYCATTSSNFNFNTWDNWAKKTSVNKNVKVLLGLPGSLAAAGSGYVPFGQLQPIVENLQKTYSSFGGVMLWDASASYANNDVSPSYQVAVANLVHSFGSGVKPSTTTTKTTTTTTTTTKAPVTSTTGVVTTTVEPTTSVKPSTTTTTTTSVTPIPTGAPSTCVSNNEACSIEGQFTCSGDSFAQCNHGKWVVRGCPSGLTCFSTADGGSVYCSPSTGSSSCPAKSNVNLGKPNTKPSPSIKAYKDGRVTAQLSVTHSDARSFKAIVNARRLDKKSFGQNVVVQFKVASNIKVTRVKNGKVTQNGNHVKVQYKNGNKKTMVAIIHIEGKIKSGVFVAPTASTMKISA